MTLSDGARDWVWREDAIARLLVENDAPTPFLAGCKSNQGRFYPQLDATAPVPALVDQLEAIAAASASRRATPARES